MLKSSHAFYLYVHIIVICTMSTEVQSECQFPYQRTDGQHFMSEEGKFYTALPIQTYVKIISGKCTMAFSQESRALSMNIVAITRSNIECQFFDRRAREDNGLKGILIDRQNATYYEKIDGYDKATSGTITVGSKGDQPGSFIFQLPTGFYKIRLNHLNGGFICSRSTQVLMTFGCSIPAGNLANSLKLVEDVQGTRITGLTGFDEFEGDGIATTFVATSSCLYMKADSKYSFWNFEDHKNDGTEDNNIGTTSFEMYVKFCEKNSACI